MRTKLKIGDFVRLKKEIDIGLPTSSQPQTYDIGILKQISGFVAKIEFPGVGKEPSPDGLWKIHVSYAFRVCRICGKPNCLSIGSK